MRTLKTAFTNGALTLGIAMTVICGCTSRSADGSAAEPTDKKVAVLTVTPAEARAIAKEAYIYGFPIVDNYRIQYAYFVDTKNPEHKATWNKLVNTPRVYTPDDKAIQTPNSDTPYS